MTNSNNQFYPLWYFRRHDEKPDQVFYLEPRLVVHTDEHAIAAITGYFGNTLPQNGVVLDMLSSWRSHMPEISAMGKVVGLGMNAIEMQNNHQLDTYVVHDLNINPALPFDKERFDAAVLIVSIQYLTRPVEVFQEVNRVLKQGARFHVIYSNRMFPTKAVAIWQQLDDLGHEKLVTSYFTNAGGWDDLVNLDISPRHSIYSDPVYVVSARKEISCSSRG